MSSQRIYFATQASGKRPKKSDNITPTFTSVGVYLVVKVIVIAMHRSIVEEEDECVESQDMNHDDQDLDYDWAAQNAGMDADDEEEGLADEFEALV